MSVQHGILIAVAALVAATSPAWAREQPSWDGCFDQAGIRYNIAPQLLRVIASHESGMDPHALNTSNVDGSYDQGLMQVNSRWRNTLLEFGIAPQDLWDACININVGAWILAGNIARYGYNWDAVGAYNAGTGNTEEVARRREAYAQKIADRLAQ